MAVWKSRCSASWLGLGGLVGCEWLGEVWWLDVLEWLGGCEERVSGEGCVGESQGHSVGVVEVD